MLKFWKQENYSVRDGRDREKISSLFPLLIDAHSWSALPEMYNFPPEPRHHLTTLNTIYLNVNILTDYKSFTRFEYYIYENFTVTVRRFFFFFS